MTRRSIAQRVKEINSATGVLIPFAARHVFRVFNAANSERAIFELLQPYRIRPDREFFELPFSKAVATIEQYLDDTRMRHRKRGKVIWFNPEKRLLSFSFAGNPIGFYLGSFLVNRQRHSRGVFCCLALNPVEI